MMKFPFPLKPVEAALVAPKSDVRKDAVAGGARVTPKRDVRKDGVAVGRLRALASAALKDRGPCDKDGEPCPLGTLKVGATVHLRMQGRLMPAVVTSLNPFAARSV
jgi:hypothetical protein